MPKTRETNNELQPEGYWKARYDLLYSMVVKSLKFSIPTWADTKYDYYLEYNIDAKTILQIFEPEKIAEYEEITQKTIEQRRKEKEE